MFKKWLVLTPFLLLSLPALAEDSWTDIGVYLFAAELDGDSTLSGVTSDVDVSFDEILENLDLGYMAYIEHRRGRWSYFGDIAYLKLTTDDSSTSDGLLEVDIDVELEQTVLEAFVGYRVLERETGSKTLGFDLYLGARNTRLDISLDSDASLLGLARSSERGDDDDWTDTVVGLRLQYGSTEGWIGSLRLDGGDGSDSSSRQLLALVGYQSDSNWVFFGGYRYLNIDVEDGGDNGFGIDIDYQGPMFGASYRL